MFLKKDFASYIREDRILSLRKNKPNEDKFYIIADDDSYENYSEILAGFNKQFRFLKAIYWIYDIDCWGSDV